MIVPIQICNQISGGIELINIIDAVNCSGCSACAAVCPNDCIEMKIDKEGFPYPSVHQETCINCDACNCVCPIINRTEETPFHQDGYVVQNKDEKVLRESTAGGAFTAIAKCVLNRHGVVFGATLLEDFSVHHVWVDNENDLYKFRNSKYIQSIMGSAFRSVKSFLKEGRMVCFSGTPCQVEGLKHYLGKEYDNLITVDVVCRAIPSPMVFKKYIELQNKRFGSTVVDVTFRDKYYGYKYSTMNITTDKNQGNYHQGVESDPWLRAFFSGMCNRPSCYNCQFKKRYRISDFTMWDCFNIGRFSRELDDDRGATRLLIHTDKGRKIFAEISEDLKYKKIEPEKIIEGTTEMTHSVSYNSEREKFMQDATVLDAEDLFNKYFPNSIKATAEHLIRMICLRLRIYSIVKKVYVRLTHKY